MKMKKIKNKFALKKIPTPLLCHLGLDIPLYYDNSNQI